MLKEDWSVFHLLDRNYDIAETVVGYKRLVGYTYPHVMSGLVRDSFKHQRHEDEEFRYYGWCKAEYIIVDWYYNVVPISNIKEDYVEPATQRWNKPNGNWVFREGPVPGTGKHKYSFYYTRAANRKQQFLQQFRDSLECREYVRAKRRYGAFNPVERRWDNDIRGDLYIRHSWKKCKKRKQWM